jgi:signal transduction histidine kinase
MSRILVVEDEQLVALDLQRRLTQLGHQVVAIADRANTAVDAVDQLHPDLILMDIHLKGENNGISAAVQIQDHYHLPIIFLTAHADVATVNEAKTTHPFGYLLKPVSTHHLSTSIDIALARHQAERSMQQALEKEQEVNAALQRALDHEKELVQMKSEFLAVITHEFRNPLSAILLALNILERYADAYTDEKRKKCIESALSAGKRMNQLIDNILIYAKLERNQFEHQPTSMNIVQFCHEIAQDFQMETSGNHTVRYTVHQDISFKPIYFLDPNLLRHILTNLISNAIKYSPDGNEVNFILFCHPTEVVFQIQDHGIGISDQDQEQLFVPFHRGKNAHNVKGTGLGLSIVKQCVEAHQGTIAVESELGVGTTFTVTLPQSTAVLSE